MLLVVCTRHLVEHSSFITAPLLFPSISITLWLPLALLPGAFPGNSKFSKSPVLIICPTRATIKYHIPIFLVVCRRHPVQHFTHHYCFHIFFHMHYLLPSFSSVAWYFSWQLFWIFQTFIFNICPTVLVCLSLIFISDTCPASVPCTRPCLIKGMCILVVNNRRKTKLGWIGWH